MAQYNSIFDFVSNGEYPGVNANVQGGVTHTLSLAPETRDTLLLVLGVYLFGKAINVW